MLRATTENCLKHHACPFSIKKISNSRTKQVNKTGDIVVL